MPGYKTITQSLSNQNNKWPGDGCNFIEFINQGDGIVFVDDVQILPWGSWAPSPPIDGHEDYTEYRIKFVQPATSFNLICVRKFMIKS
jgi:hypothetical protein